MRPTATPRFCPGAHHFHDRGKTGYVDDRRQRRGAQRQRPPHETVAGDEAAQSDQADLLFLHRVPGLPPFGPTALEGIDS